MSSTENSSSSPASGPEPVVVLTNTEFVALCKRAASAGCDLPITPIPSVLCPPSTLADLSTLGTPEEEGAKFRVFETDVASMRKQLSELDKRVQNLQASLGAVLTKTSEVVVSMQRQSTTLHVVVDSVRVGLFNLEQVPKANSDQNILRAKAALDTALACYNKTV